jgi:hypothetical protein
MATNYPSSLDDFTNPTADDSLNSDTVPHADQHANVNDAVEALQAKVGADSSAVTSSHDYKIADHASRLTTLESDVAGFTSGKILQVVHAVQTSEFSSSSTSFVDVTGSSASITPSSISSKVLVLVNGSLSLPDNLIVDFTIFRGNAATGTNLGHSSFGFGRPRDDTPGTLGIQMISATTLDSPATTSAVTYQLAMKCQTATTFYYGTSGSHATVTLMEVAA